MTSEKQYIIEEEIFDEIDTNINEIYPKDNINKEIKSFFIIYWIYWNV